MQHSKSDQTHATAGGRRQRIVARGVAVAGTVGLAAAVLLPAGPALAAPQAASPPAPTTATVVIGSAIALTALTPTFTLNGVPGDSPEDLGAVTMDVFTTNATGYNVTVEAAAPALVGTATPTNVIPVGDISVRQTGTTPYAALSDTTAVTVHTQTTPSVADPGDVLSNDYDFTTPIPSVPSDTYTVTLNYIATTNP